MFSSQFRYTCRSRLSGWKRSAPSFAAAIAGSARPFMSQNHWSEISGSMRWPGAMRVRHVVHVGLRARDEPLLAQRGDDGVARLVDVQAREALAGGLGHAPVLADHA